MTVVQYVTKTIAARDLVRGDIFDHHNRRWTVLTAWQGEHGSVCVRTVGDGRMWVAADSVLTVRRRVR